MIWIEILSHHKEVVSRSCHDSTTVFIGRGYENDLVLDDPYIASRHICIQRTEEKLSAQDLYSKNGILDTKGDKHQQLPLTGSTCFRIGNTWLRVRTEQEAVAEELLLVPPKRIWPWLLLLIGLLAGATALQIWLKQTTKPELRTYIEPLAWLGIYTTIWTAGWAAVNRLLAGRARFGMHLLIMLSACLLYTSLQSLIPWLSFAFSVRFVLDYQAIFTWLLIGAACLAHLYVISHRLRWIKFAIVAGLAATGVSIQLMNYNAWAKPFFEEGKEPFLRVFWPPQARMSAANSEEQFFQQIEAMQAELDHRTNEDEGMENEGENL